MSESEECRRIVSVHQQKLGLRGFLNARNPCVSLEAVFSRPAIHFELLRGKFTVANVLRHEIVPPQNLRTHSRTRYDSVEILRWTTVAECLCYDRNSAS